MKPEYSDNFSLRATQYFEPVGLVAFGVFHNRIKDLIDTATLTPEEFEGVLRPAFQADERTLIIVGAILGFLVGELQVLMVEHLAH